MNTMKQINFLKKILALVLSFVILLSFSACSGNKKDKVYHVGILSGLDFIGVAADSFKNKMTELGYIEGENIVYDIQKTNSDMDDYNNFSKKFVEDKVDLVFGFPTEAALALQEATKGTDIPVIFAVTNIEGNTLVNSVREPGGNITGVRYPGPDIAIKRLEIMLQLAPNIKRVCIPYSSDLPVCAPQMEELRPAAQQLGVTLVEAPLKTVEDLTKYFEEHDVEGDVGFDAIVTIADNFSAMPEPFVTMSKFSNKHKVPFGGTIVQTEGDTALFEVNINPEISGKKAAELADKVLKGEKVGTVPVVSDESSIIINLKEAQKWGLTVPDDLLGQAANVIK